MINPVNNAKNIMDIQTSGLDNLKQIDGKNLPEDKLMKASQDFEAVFLTKMFNIINSTVEKDQGFIKVGKHESTFKTFYYGEMAKNIASNPETSIGMAKQIYEQMKDLV